MTLILPALLQGFCLSSMTLRPSAFYAAAGLRTSALKGAIARAGLRGCQTEKMPLLERGVVTFLALAILYS